MTEIAKPSTGGEFDRTLIQLGSIHKDKAAEIGLFTPHEKVEAMSMDESLDLAERIAASVGEDLKPYWDMGLKGVILHGDEVLAPLIDFERFDFRKFAENSSFIALSIHRPLTVLLL